VCGQIVDGTVIVEAA